MKCSICREGEARAVKRGCDCAAAVVCHLGYLFLFIWIFDIFPHSCPRPKPVISTGEQCTLDQDIQEAGLPNQVRGKQSDTKLCVLIFLMKSIPRDHRCDMKTSEMDEVGKYSLTHPTMTVYRFLQKRKYRNKYELL